MEPTATVTPLKRAARLLGLVLVAIGLLNTIPSIPGLDAFVQDMVGNPDFPIRKFPYQWLYPIAFVLMMAIVALNHSFRAQYAHLNRGAIWRGFGLFMDIALVVMSVLVALAYLVEIDSVCLIDRVTGERAELISRALAEEREFAELYGLPAPTSVDDPACINTLGGWIFVVVGAGIAVFLGYNVRVWGLALVSVAILIAAYTLATVLAWYVFGAEDMNKYLITKLGGEPRMLMDGRPNVEDILVNNAQGILGYVGPTDDSGCHPMMMAQYSLAPVRLVEVDYDLFRRSLQDRAVEVTPLAPQLVLAWGDEGQRWMRRNPDYVRIAETPSAVLLARAP